MGFGWGGYYPIYRPWWGPYYGYRPVRASRLLPSLLSAGLCAADALSAGEHQHHEHQRLQPARDRASRRSPGDAAGGAAGQPSDSRPAGGCAPGDAARHARPAFDAAFDVPGQPATRPGTTQPSTQPATRPVTRPSDNVYAGPDGNVYRPAARSAGRLGDERPGNGGSPCSPHVLAAASPAQPDRSRVTRPARPEQPSTRPAPAGPTADPSTLNQLSRDQRGRSAGDTRMQAPPAAEAAVVLATTTSKAPAKPRAAEEAVRGE